MESIKEKDHYIGIHGKFSFMMIKTPTEYESRNFISASPLYEFYGPELPKKQE
jgi:hypothetical protein